MALEQTLELAKNIVLCTQRNPLIPSLHPNPFAPVRLLCSPVKVLKNRRLSIYGGVKCWTDNNNNGGRSNGSGWPQYPRPSEIPWNKELANNIQLVGYVMTPLQSHSFPTKFAARTRLAVKNPPTDNSWVSLQFWDDLAHIAVQHVRQGDLIYVSGRLISMTESENGKNQTYYQVVVKKLNFIDRKDSNDVASGSMNQVTVEQLWQAFFANPLDWWDNRKNKRNPKAPDFKHKDTGEVLWVQGWSNPPWVESQLEILDTRMGSVRVRDQNEGMQVNFDVGDDYTHY